MSTLASSSEKDFQVPISTSYHPNRPSSQDSPSEPPPFRLLDAVPKCMVPFVPIFLFGSMGIFSVARLDNLLTEGNDDEWIAYRDAVVTRVNNINVVGSLFITGAAVFMSTVSTNQDLADWGSRTSFLAFGGTVGTAMLAILAGCIISYILMDMQAADLRRERFRWVKIMLIIVFLWAHTALLLQALCLVLIALFAAVWSGVSKMTRLGAIYIAVVTGCQLLGALVLVILACASDG